MDIFSVFDEQHKIFKEAWMLMWLIVFSVTASLSSRSLKSAWNPLLSLVYKIAYPLYNQSAISKMAGTAGMFTGLLYLLGVMNLLGLLPYVFSVTSHIAVNFSVSLPIWLSMVSMSAFFNFGVFIAHFLPSGSPLALSPFLCIIELVSQLVRPLTMAIRLTANLSAGHIIVVLMAASCGGKALVLVGVISFYLLYEVAVCIVQSYIFVLLPTLYGDEHPSECVGMSWL